jgi:type III restriction enzyme
VTLHEALAPKVTAWRRAGYPCEEFPAVAECLEWARGDEESGNVRFLREPQLRALETYWYLRTVEQTPKVPELYRRVFTRQSDLLNALGLSTEGLKERALDLGSVDALLDAIREDDELVRAHRLEALRETLSLDYPSYILALAMGAGKTILIGAIVATEFAMAMEYPDGPFVQNALVFAPGKTIIESLRELLAVPYESIVPPRFNRSFNASAKFTFTRDGEKDIPVVRGSSFNIVVTNTEKIRIQKESIRKSDLGSLFSAEKLDEARQEVANQRLQAIASLPHLGVFSDEAHHTYGQSLDSELKKVRKTVDYLSSQTRVACVINTTGTPYFQRQPLRDVVIWYGLSQGIRENILKDVSDNIQMFDVGDDTPHYVRHVIADFFGDYRDVTLPNGARSKLAVYFPQTDDLARLRPVIDAALVAIGLDPTICLVNTSDTALTKKADEDAFNRLNDPASPHRVILLVNKGTEGWNCPSLFACALARTLRTSNNFVLQAASRCLRQVPGNTTRARIYLSRENYGVLDRQLRETYGETIEELSRATQEIRSERLVLRKVPIPPILVTQLVRTVTRAARSGHTPLSVIAPHVKVEPATKTAFTMGEGSRGVLRQIADSVVIERPVSILDLFTVAVDLSSRYRLDPLAVHRALSSAYPAGGIPVTHVDDLAGQLEAQTRHYETREERVERALALVKEESFSRERNEHGVDIYVAEIRYRADGERNLLRWTDLQDRNPKGLGFHYDPIEFDSQPERRFFESVLVHLNVKPWEVEDVYFTGGLTDPAKTDFFVEYRTTEGRWRRYTPDFVIRKKPAPGLPPGSGRVLIVEIKREKDREDPVDGIRGAKALAVRKWEALNPDRLKYEMIFTPSDTVTFNQLIPVWKFAEEREVFLPIALPMDQLRHFCQKWRIQDMAVFGSVLRKDFGPDSDLDFLVTFKPHAGVSLFDLVKMEAELAEVVGRRVDIVSRRGIERSENWIRRKAILESARSLHVAG